MNYELAIEKARKTFSNKNQFEKEKAFALQYFKKNSLLQGCESESITNAIANIALLGISLNPVIQQAYLIPYKKNCALQVSYRGLISISLQSGIKDINAFVVYEGDEFYLELGLNPVLKHVPNLNSKGDLKHVYAIAVLPNGEKKFTVINKDEVENIRKMSQNPNSTLYVNFYDEAAKKIAIKKLFKYLPINNIDNAISVINETEGIEKVEEKTETEAEVEAKVKKAQVETKIEAEVEAKVEAEVPIPQIKTLKKNSENLYKILSESFKDRNVIKSELIKLTGANSFFDLDEEIALSAISTLKKQQNEEEVLPNKVLSNSVKELKDILLQMYDSSNIEEELKKLVPNVNSFNELTDVQATEALETLTSSVMEDY